MPAASLASQTVGRAATDDRAGNLIVTTRSALSAQSLGPGRRVQSQRFSEGRHVEVIHADDVDAAMTRLRADRSVLSVIRDRTLYAQASPATFTPTDPLGRYQWQDTLMGYAAVQADKPETYKNAVTVAVVDTGVRFDHPDLAGRLYGPGDGAMDFTADPANGDGDGVDTDATDPGTPGGGSHGTSVTGLIAANSNAQGIAGGTLNAPVKVLPIRVLGSDNGGQISDITLGVRYASGEPVTVGSVTYTNPHPARVINLSLGNVGSHLSADEKAYVCDAVSAATARGALVVAASGNSGTNDPEYPASCPGAVAVGSVTLDQNRAWVRAPYSGFGPHVSLSAPGGYVKTAYNGTMASDGVVTTGYITSTGETGYVIEQGTSFATPEVSAVAALLLSKGLTTGNDDTRLRLLSTASDAGVAGRDDDTGAGVLNASAALGLAATTTPVTGLPTPTPTVTTAYLVRVTETKSGQVFKPAAYSDGTWTVYLPSGTYTAQSGPDTNGDGLLSAEEITKSQTVVLADQRSKILP